MTTARRLVNKLMVVAPLVLLAGIGVQSRTYADDYEPVSSTPEQDQATLAYREVAIATREALDREPSPQRSEELRLLAMQWTEGARTGRLQTLPPVAYDDTSMEGIRGDITSLATRLSVELTNQGRHEEQAGRHTNAANDYLHAMKVAEVTKYFDFQAVTKSAMTQRRVLTMLNHVLPRLTSYDHARMAESIRDIRGRQRGLSEIGLLTRRQYIEASARTGRRPLGIEAAPQMVTYRELFQGERPDQAKLQELKSLMLASNTGPERPEFVSIASVALQAQAHLEDELTGFENALRGGR